MAKPRNAIPEVNRLALRLATRGYSEELRRSADKSGAAEQLEELRELLAPCRHAKGIATMLKAYDWDLDALNADVLRVGEILLSPERSPAKRGRGRPREWTKSNMFYVWVQVEAHYRAQSAAGHKATLKKAIDALFKGLPRTAKACVLWNAAGGKSLYVTRKTAAKHYQAARKRFLTLPTSAQLRLNATVERAKQHNLDEWK